MVQRLKTKPEACLRACDGLFLPHPQAGADLKVAISSVRNKIFSQTMFLDHPTEGPLGLVGGASGFGPAQLSQKNFGTKTDIFGKTGSKMANGLFLPQNLWLEIPTQEVPTQQDW